LKGVAGRHDLEVCFFDEFVYGPKDPMMAMGWIRPPIVAHDDAIAAQQCRSA
jgi:hypothetical protein